MGDNIRYVLCPGIVRSKTDGDRHYIDAPTLARLYGVRLEECYVHDGRPRSERLPDGLICLRPRYDGNYSLPGGSNDPNN